MAPSDDEDDTQVLVFDSPLSGDSDGFLGGQTLPLDYEETQRVDSSDDDQLGEGFQEWGKTHAINGYEETEVIQHEDEYGEGHSERTELVGDEAGIANDFGEVESEVRAKEAYLADPDASTDEEEGHDFDKPGSSSCIITCIPKGKKSKSSDLHKGGFSTHNHEKAGESHTELEASLIVTMPCSVGTKKDEILLDHVAENSSRNIECGTEFYQYTEEETKLRSKLDREKLDSHSPLRFGQAVAGLSYVSSQEPGIQSQAFALEVVDKFLLANNVGLSQDGVAENIDTVTSPPIASLKRAQCFVRKSDKSIVGKAQVYDWNDSLEDEGGGELFSRRKNVFFGGKGSKRISKSLPSKVTLYGSEIIIGGNYKRSNGSAKCRTSQKLASLSETMNCINEKNEQTYSEMAEQLKKSYAQVSDEGGYTIGPATQLAAEAMQALGQSSHANFEQNALRSKSREITGKSTKTIKARRTRSISTSAGKVRNKYEGILAHQRQETSIKKSRTKNCNAVRKQPTRQAKRMGLKDSRAELSAKTTNERSSKKSKEVTSFNNGGYAARIIEKKMKNIGDKEAKNPPILMTYSKQFLVDGKSKADTNEMYTSPVAHRTRYSKAAKILKDDNGNEFSGLADENEMEMELKRRKINIDLSNLASNCKMNNHINVVDDVFAQKGKQPFIEKKKRKIFIRSIAEILDTVKRKKRSISSSCKSDGLTFNDGKMQDLSGIPSLLSDILKPYFANDVRLKDQISCKPASYGVVSTCSEFSLKQVVKENTEHEEIPKAVIPPGLSCSLATERNSSLPVPNSHDASSSFCKSLSRSPMSRELIRLEASYALPLKLNDVRRRKDMSSFFVCFSNHLSQGVIKQQKKISEKLGIQIVSSSLKATHFVADEFVRTRNMLEAMAMGKPVVSPMWLESCGQANSYIDEKNFILRDARKEKEIGFSMPVSLARACQQPLLQGKRVFTTRNARPDQKLISSLVETAGGQPLKRVELSETDGDEARKNLIILSAEEDYAICAPFLKKGTVVFSSELLLNGIVVQKLEYERHQLFMNQNERRH